MYLVSHGYALNWYYYQLSPDSNLGDLGQNGTYYWRHTYIRGHQNVKGYSPYIPVLTSCGTGSPTVTGNDTAGYFTIGATGTGCIATFGTAYTNKPECQCRAEVSSTMTSCVPTNTAITVVGAAGAVIHYDCKGLSE